jgi:hypothetical protein
VRTYTFKLVIYEQSDEFWESLGDRAGTEEVRAWIKEMLEADNGLRCDGEYKNCDLLLEAYKWRED